MTTHLPVRTFGSRCESFTRTLMGACFAVLLGGTPVLAADAVRAPDEAQIRQRLGGLAIPFEANAGQFDPRVAFMARTFAGTVFVTRDGQLVHGFPGRAAAGADARKRIRKSSRGWVLTESLIGAHPSVHGQTRSATKVSRFIGNDPSRWQGTVPTYDRVGLGEAWPGIDVALVAHGSTVETFFTLAPGADAGRIAVRVGGAKSLALAADGAIVASTGIGPVSFSAPKAWQDIGGERRPVRVAYALAGDRYGFRLGGYDSAFPVVIDPIKQSTYVGYNDTEPYAIALNANGDVYVTGFTGESSPDFLGALGVTGGAQSNPGGGPGGGVGDAFVVRLRNDLQAPIAAATYLGGNGHEHGNAIAVDSSNGNVFVAGYTSSSDFPGTNGGVQPANTAGATKAFVAKLDGALTTIAATYLGGNGAEHANGIALNASGDVLVAGDTTSTAGFPGMTSTSAQQFIGGNSDAFVARLGNGLNTILQSTYLGGAGSDSANGIAVRANEVFVVGNTGSTSFPNMNGAAQSGNGGLGDAFVAKLNGALTTVAQATYLGGGGNDYGNDIAVRASTGDVYITGYTDSVVFPGTATGAQQNFGGYSDAFVARFDNSLSASSPVQSTFFGGVMDDYGTAIALDPAGNVFVAGLTRSQNLPGMVNGVQPTFNGFGYIQFVARLNDTLTAPVTQATYLGTGLENGMPSLALDGNGYVFVAGRTDSMNFPGWMNGAQVHFYYTAPDGYVSKLTHGLHDQANATANDDGDPHITTVSGLHYNFQSAGEFTALRAGSALEIQTRQSPTSTWGAYFDSHTGLTTCVSVNTALAARVGSHRVTYEPDFKNPADPNGLQLRVDGRLAPLTPAGISLSGGGRVALTAGALEIDFPDGTVLIATPFHAPPQWLFNVAVYGVDDGAGLMGSVPQGSWLPSLANGASVGVMPPATAAGMHQRFVVLNQTFANSWRVNAKTSLFDYAPGTSTATYTNPRWPAEKAESCRVPNMPAPPKPIDQGHAREICREVADKRRNADCVFDVAVTGQPGFAKAYLLAQRIQDGATRIDLGNNLAAVGAKPKTAAIFTATVTRISSGDKVAAGFVQFLLDGEKASEPIRLDKDGAARWTAEGLKPGTHRLSANFTPAKESVFLPSSSVESVVGFKDFGRDGSRR